MNLEETTVQRASEPVSYHDIAVVVTLENLQERRQQLEVQELFTNLQRPLNDLCYRNKPLSKKKLASATHESKTFTG